MLQYLAARGASTKNQVKAPADYYINNQGEYVVHLQLLQKGASVIDLSLAAPSLSAAKAMCRQWPKKYEEIMQKYGGAFNKAPPLFISDIVIVQYLHSCTLGKIALADNYSIFISTRV